VDNDGDGYDTGTDTGCVAIDCDDSDSQVSPDESEDLGNGIDDDCDGLIDYGFQLLEAPLFSGLWWLDHRATWSQGTVTLSPIAGDTDAYIELLTEFDWDRGELHAVLGITSGSDLVNADCYAEVVTEQGTFRSHRILGTGEQAAAVGFSPYLTRPFHVYDFSVHCEWVTGSPSVTLDYVNLVNADYAWPPPADQDLVYTDTSFEGGGYESAVVRSAAVSGEVLAASNTHGVAWSDDGEVWYSINGELDGSELWAQDFLSAWDVEAVDANDLYVLTGRGDDDPSGGLFRTTDLGTTWTDVGAGTAVEGTAHTCGGKDADAYAGGRLLESWTPPQEDTVVLYGNHKSGSAGVYAWDTGTDQACTRSTGFQSLPADRVSSLALTTLEGSDYLLAGYKGRTAAADALYVCQLDGSCGGANGVASACQAVAGSGWDVRDLAVQEDPTYGSYGRSLVYVADGGRRLSASDACSAQEGTVHVVQIAGTGGSPSITSWDSDDPTYATCTPDDGTGSPDISGCPDWLYTGTPPGSDLVYVTAVFKHDQLGSGELRVSDTGAASTIELVGLAFDEVGTLLAFVHRPQSNPYGYPRVFRADVSTPPTSGTTLDWVPLQDYSTGEPYLDTDPTDPYDSNAEERAHAADVVDGWLRGLDPYDDLQGWFPGRSVDGEFYTKAGAEAAGVLVNGGLGMLWLPPETALAPGWDSAYGDPVYDLDDIPWAYAIQPDSDFQTTVPAAVGWCDACYASGKMQQGLAWAASWDVTLESLYGPPTAGAVREPAWYDCHFENWEAGGRDVDVVEDASGATVWVGLWQQSSKRPTRQGIVKGTLAPGDDHDDIDWCFETTSSYLATSQVFDPAGPDWMCKRGDEDTGFWPDYATIPACDAGLGTSGGRLLTSDVPTEYHYGNVYDIEALAAAPSVAFATLASWDDGDTASPGYEGAGALALLYDDVATGDMVLEAVPEPGSDLAGTSCAGWSYDQVMDNVPLITVDQKASVWESSTVYNLRLYLLAGDGTSSGDDCSLFQVDVTYAGGIDATWTPIALGSAASDCTNLGAGQLLGAATADWAPDTLWVHGNAVGEDALCELDLSTPGSPAYYPLAKNDSRQRRVTYVEPHPHLAYTLLVGMTVQDGEGCTNATCERPGLYQAAWRMRGLLGQWAPDFRALPDDGLYNANVTGVAADSRQMASGDYEVESLWVSTGGGGVWQGDRAWRDP